MRVWVELVCCRWDKVRWKMVGQNERKAGFFKSLLSCLN